MYHSHSLKQHICLKTALDFWNASISLEYDMICWIGLAVVKYHKHPGIGRVVCCWVVCHMTSSPWFRRQNMQTSTPLTSISSGYLDWEHVLMSSGISAAITKWIWSIHSKINTGSIRRPLKSKVKQKKYK